MSLGLNHTVLGTCNATTYYYSDSDVYVDKSIVVWGNKVSPRPTKIDPGTHNYPFEFTLPSDCPPTFNMFHGKIKYRLLVAVSSQTKEYKVEAPLTVGYVVDLYSQPHLLEPVNKTIVKNVTVCCCCNGGTAEITVNLPQTGFCTERDHIPITCECRNSSSQMITVRGDVSQLIVFRANYHSTSVPKTFGGVFVQHVQPSGDETRSFKFAIPTSVLPDFSTRIIRLSHVVSFFITNTYGFIPSYIQIPVVIGNVPFLSQSNGIGSASPNTHTSPQGLASIQASCPPEQSTVPPTAELQSEAPPSYRAVISGEEF